MKKKTASLKNHIISGGKDLMHHIVTIAFDLFLLFFWAYTQYLFQKLKPDSLAGFDQLTILVLQIIFFISPLIPIIICIYKHIIIMANKARKEIKDSRDES